MDFVCGVASGPGVIVVVAYEVMKVSQGANDRLAAASGQFGEQRLHDFLVRVAGRDPPCLALHIVGDVNDGAVVERKFSFNIAFTRPWVR